MGNAARGRFTVRQQIKLASATGSTRAANNRTLKENSILELERKKRRLRMEVDGLEQAALIFTQKQDRHRAALSRIPY